MNASCIGQASRMIHSTQMNETCRVAHVNTSHHYEYVPNIKVVTMNYFRGKLDLIVKSQSNTEFNAKTSRFHYKEMQASFNSRKSLF